MDEWIDRSLIVLLPVRGRSVCALAPLARTSQASDDDYKGVH